VEFTPFNNDAPTKKRRSYLPHWIQKGTAYFVTFRLADALPTGLLRTLEIERNAWLRHHPQPWTDEVQREYHERFTVRIDRHLDESHGNCLLRSERNRTIVLDALMHFDPERCRQIAWVIMPNHVHLLVVPNEGWDLDRLVRSWKTFTARKLNELCGESGPVWQKDYFDRIIRDDEHFHKVVGYIRRNPVKAKLRAGEYTQWQSAELNSDCH
jgi:putative transposase